MNKSRILKYVFLLQVLATIIWVTVPVIASGFNHQVVYELDGRVDFKQKLGHICNTGAERKMTITGDGEISKSTNTVMAEGILMVEDSQEWVTAEDALRNMVVTSTTLLCSPPKTEYVVTHYTPVRGEN